MSKGRSPWQGGRRAWERLDGWHQDGPRATPGHPDDGDGALEALADVGLVRHLLDQAELVAVRTARRHGKSWAEIAVKLGVTRQSAWERWRDLDETSPPVHSGSLDEFDVDVEPTASATPGASMPTGIIARAAGELRRRSSIVVPNVVGLSCRDAQAALSDKGLGAVGLDPDGVPLSPLDWPEELVRDQTPESGAKVPAGSSVSLWIRPGGGLAGVREPRRPKPGPRSAREMREEPQDEAVS
jgi:PASTA domain